MTSWVQWLQRHIQSEKLAEPIVSPLKLGKWGGQSDIPFTHTIGCLPNPCEFFLYLNCGHDMKPIGWWSYRVRVKCSLVLLEIFSHPCPTLAPSYPHPYSQLGTPIVLSGKLEMSFYLYNRIPSKWGWAKINLKVIELTWGRYPEGLPEYLQDDRSRSYSGVACN